MRTIKEKRLSALRWAIMRGIQRGRPGDTLNKIRARIFVIGTECD